MATSKTLTPTNVTIQIPEFTDQPDQRVNSNCIDKEADAINALNSKIPNPVNTKSGFSSSEIFGSGSSNTFVVRGYLNSTTNNYLQLAIQGNNKVASLIRATNGTESTLLDLNDVQKPGTWSGNQTIASLQTNCTKSGIGSCYLQDPTYGNGWSTVIAQIDSSNKGILILNDSKIIYTRSTGTIWSTHSINF